MVRKAKTTSTKAKPSRGSARPLKPTLPGPLPWAKLVDLYPSLAQGPTTQERREKLAEQARAHGIRPMTEKEFDRYLEEFKDLWPDDEIDAFVAPRGRGYRRGVIPVQEAADMPVWAGTWSTSSAKMIRKDLAEARKKWLQTFQDAGQRTEADESDLEAWPLCPRCLA